MGVFKTIAASLALFVGGLTSPALAKDCPNGIILANTFEHYYASGPNTWGQAILYWQDYGAAAVDTRTKIVRSLLECYGNYCGMGEGDTTAHATLKTYYQDLAAFEGGRSTVKPAFPDGLEAPPPVMLAWAEKRFGCTAGPTYLERQAAQQAAYKAEQAEKARIAALPKKPATREEIVRRSNIVDDWEFYEIARKEGGALFYRWWDANKKMRTIQDAYDMCYFHKPTSVECTWPKAWADRMSGKKTYWGSGQSNLPNNGTYTESYTDKYGYTGPSGGSPSAPTNNEARCYNQGDGTEKCFYD